MQSLEEARALAAEGAGGTLSDVSSSDDGDRDHDEWEEVRRRGLGDGGRGLGEDGGGVKGRASGEWAGWVEWEHSDRQGGVRGRVQIGVGLERWRGLGAGRGSLGRRCASVRWITLNLYTQVCVPEHVTRVFEARAPDSILTNKPTRPASA